MTAQEWLRAGVVLLSEGRFREALAAFDRALELDPSNAAPWNGKGIALDNLGKRRDAIDAFEQAIELDPSNAAPWNGKGNALHRLGKHRDAIAAYERAIELVPVFAAPWNGKGMALESLGEHRDAIDAFERAIELVPAYATPWNEKGNALDNLGKHRDAIAAYERAIELDPAFAASWNGKGNALNSLGKHRDAIASYERAIEFAPSNAVPWNGKGNAFYNLDKHRDAIAAYDRAIELDPAFAEPWQGKGVCLIKQPHLLERGSRETGARCLHRAAVLWKDRSPRTILDSVEVFLHAPHLLLGLIERWGVVPESFGDFSRLAWLERETRLPVAILRWLDDEACPLDAAERLRLKGQVYLAFADPIRAYEALDELDSLDSTDLAGQLHLWWAMDERLDDTDAHRRSALAMAVEMTAAIDADPMDCYYAGHLHFHGGDFAGAAALFQRVGTAGRPATAGEWPPALLMRWLCAIRLKDESTAAALAERVLAREAVWLDGGIPRSLLFSFEPPPIDPRSLEGLDELRWLFHDVEVREAVAEYLDHLDAIERIASPVARALLKRLEMMHGPIHEDIAQRRPVWQSVEEFAREFRDRRQAIDPQRAAARRMELRDDLARLGVDGSAGLSADIRTAEQQREALAALLARRVHETNFKQAPVRAEDCLALLLSERRMSVHDATLLIIYTHAKRSHDVGAAGPHRALVVKAALSSLIGAVLNIVGFEFVYATFATYVGIGLQGWLTDHGMAAVRVGHNGEFPTYSQFVRDLHHRWHEMGGPRSTEQLFPPGCPRLGF